MHQALHYTLWLALAGTSLVACKKAGDDPENGPAQVRGEWRLAVSGGGITGRMEPVAPDLDIRSVFGPDSTYTEYLNGKRTLTSTFYVASRPAYAGGPAVPVLAIKSTNSPSGQPYYRVQYITELTATTLSVTTGGGCAMNSEYVRVKPETYTSSL